MSNLLTQHFYESAERYSSKAALMEKVNGQYRSITYQEMKERVEQVAAFLIENGLQPGDRVALLAENRPEWPIGDMAIISAALVNVPIYPTLSASQIQYVLNDSGSRAILVSSVAQLQKIREIYQACPQLEWVVIFDALPSDMRLPGLRLLDYKAVLSEGEAAFKQVSSSLQRRISDAQPDDLVSLVYTSGTTGNPKGVMLTHRNFASNALAAKKAAGFTAEHVSLSFLPLSHVLERVVNYVMQVAGATVAYAESIDTIAANLQEIHPTVFVAVPRVFEKIHARIIANVENGPPFKKKMFYWALDIGKQANEYLTRNEALPGVLALKHALADRLVFTKIRERTGGKLQFAISGGAPLMRELAEFFFAVGIPIYEGYGLTETSPVICVNRPGAVRFGSVGQVLEGVEVKIAADGEILSRGPNTMKGYFNLPEATQEAIDSEGWFHTGDIGELDAHGFLRITDRKKELIIMSNGKNVAPQPIENALKSSSLIEQAVLLGNNEKYMAALIYPHYEALEKIAKEKSIAVQSRLEMVNSQQIQDLIRAEIDQATKGFARYEQIKRFALIEEELTQENDCLTPTLKYKRRVIHDKYKELIAQLFVEVSV